MERPAAQRRAATHVRGALRWHAQAKGLAYGATMGGEDLGRERNGEAGLGARTLLGAPGLTTSNKM